MASRAIIVREHGVDAAGLYQATWALSGMFAGFILAAIGTDFYPRLTAAIQDQACTVRLLDEPLAQRIAGDGMVSSIARGKAHGNSC